MSALVECWDCAVEFSPTPKTDADFPLCKGCEENAAEDAYQRSLEAFYGGSGPQTTQEQAEAAWLLREELRRG